MTAPSSALLHPSCSAFSMLSALVLLTAGCSDDAPPPSADATTDPAVVTSSSGESTASQPTSATASGDDSVDTTGTPATDTGPSPTTSTTDTDTTGEPADDDLCDVGGWDGAPPQVLSLTGNTFAHDPTMIEADGTYYRFWTGPDVPSASSTDLLHWTDAPPAFQGGYPPWVGQWLGSIPGEQFNFPWAPDVSYFEGQYHLYSSFSAVFGDNISCITHLTTEDPAAGGWVDHEPVICSDGSESYNAIDADVGVDLEGTPWLAFGSFWDGIMAFELAPDGSRASDELHHLAWAPQIEAPVLFRRCGYYYLFVSWGVCCPGANPPDLVSYRVAVGRSEDIMGPYVDREGVPMVDGGGTLILEGDGVDWVAAGHSDVLATDDAIYHLYHAYEQGSNAAVFRMAELMFDDDGWPVPHPP